MMNSIVKKYILAGTIFSSVALAGVMMTYRMNLLDVMSKVDSKSPSAGRNSQYSYNYDLKPTPPEPLPKRPDCLSKGRFPKHTSNALNSAFLSLQNKVSGFKIKWVDTGLIEGDGNLLTNM